jgi:hypothetical protein
MRLRESKKLFNVVLVFQNDVTRTVTVKAISREVAESRALKRNPSAIAVKRHG